MFTLLVLSCVGSFCYSPEPIKLPDLDTCVRQGNAVIQQSTIPYTDTDGIAKIGKDPKNPGQIVFIDGSRGMEIKFQCQSENTTLTAR